MLDTHWLHWYCRQFVLSNDQSSVRLRKLVAFCSRCLHRFSAAGDLLSSTTRTGVRRFICAKMPWVAEFLHFGAFHWNTRSREPSSPASAIDAKATAMLAEMIKTIRMINIKVPEGCANWDPNDLSDTQDWMEKPRKWEPSLTSFLQFSEFPKEIRQKV